MALLVVHEAATNKIDRNLLSLENGVVVVSDLCRLRRERQREPDMTAVAARRCAEAGLREAERETPARTETD